MPEQYLIFHSTTVYANLYVHILRRNIFIEQTLIYIYKFVKGLFHLE